MVLLHPGIGDSRVWDLIAPRLAARYRVIRYDARGHGMSPPATAPFNLLDDLITVLDQLEVARATMVGCSQGGATSIDLALAQPERVSALVLVSPGVSGYPMPGNPELDAQFEACAEVGDVEGIARLAGGIWTTGEPDDAVLAQLRSAAKAWLANDEYEKPGRRRSSVSAASRRRPCCLSGTRTTRRSSNATRRSWPASPGAARLTSAGATTCCRCGFRNSSRTRSRSSRAEPPPCPPARRG